MARQQSSDPRRECRLLAGTSATLPSGPNFVCFRALCRHARYRIRQPRLTRMYGPAVRCKRVSWSWGRRSCINVSGLWVGLIAPGHHGNQRACDLISGQASTGHPGHQCSQAPGRPILHLFSSSRRPRRVFRVRQRGLRLALIDQAGRVAASASLAASKLRPWARTPHAMRASLLASAIASTLRCSRLLAASIQGLSP